MTEEAAGQTRGKAFLWGVVVPFMVPSWLVIPLVVVFVSDGLGFALYGVEYVALFATRKQWSPMFALALVPIWLFRARTQSARNALARFMEAILSGLWGVFMLAIWVSHLF